MNTVRTMPRVYERTSKTVVHRATTSTPIKQSSLASLGYNKAQQASINRIKAEM